MSAEHEIRADFNRDTITVYQAYSSAIADAALAAGRFVAPFSFGRMTWIKPSFLWLMHRSNWGQKSGQERILAVRMTRTGWEAALSAGVLTGFERGIFQSYEDWQFQIASARVHVQWDPERSLRGEALPYRSIQVGVSRHMIREYVDQWIVSLEDYTPCVRKIRELMQSGRVDQAKRHLPAEKVYPVAGAIARRLGME